MAPPIGFGPTSPYNTQWQAMQYYSQVGQNLTYNQLRQWNPQYLADWYLRHNQQLRTQNAQLYRYVYQQVQSNNALSYIDPYIRNPAALGYGVQNPDQVYGSQNWAQQAQAPIEGQQQPQQEQGPTAEQVEEAEREGARGLGGTAMGIAGAIAGGPVGWIAAGVNFLSDLIPKHTVVGGILHGVKEVAGSVVKGAIDVVGGVVKGVGSAIGGIVKGIGSIFKGW